MKAQSRVALPTIFSFVALLIVLALSTRGADPNPPAPSGDAAALPPPSNGAISPQNQADALHFVIAVDREMYVRAYVAWQTGNAAAPKASADSQPRGSWPSPCEMVRRAGESIQSKGAEFSYALRSLRPIDPRNEPQTELEQRGLAFITGHPDQNYSGQEMLGGRRYFTTVYPDIPAETACIDCHKRKSASNPQLYKIGDIMGGVVVRIPLEF